MKRLFRHGPAAYMKEIARQRRPQNLGIVHCYDHYLIAASR